MSMNNIRLPAPAKLNLMLRIIGRRQDGYHLLQSVFQFIDRCDWINLSVRNDGKINLANPLPGVPETSDLTVCAANLLKSKVGNPTLGVDIRVEKCLPMGGGLGGGSSDAATVLLGLNTLWDLGFSLEKLAEMGLSLGADVPVFVLGQAAWAEGVGEILTPVGQELDEPWYVVITPRCQVATAAIFSAPNLTRNSEPIKMRDFVLGNKRNDCLPVVESLYSEVHDAIRTLSEFSSGPRLTGTGACVFADFEDRAVALNVASELADQGLEVFVAKGENVSPLHRHLFGDGGASIPLS